MAFTDDMNLELISAGASNGNETVNDNMELIDLGRTGEHTAGDDIDAGLWLYLDSASQKLLKAKADSKTTSKVLGIGCATVDVLTDATMYPRRNGSLELSDWTNVIGSATLTAGSEYFLSTTTAGQMSTTVPTGLNKIVKLGYAKTTTKFIIAIQEYLEGDPTVLDFSTEGPTHNLDVDNVEIILINTTANHVTIGGFINGVRGQTLKIATVTSANNAVLEHDEGTGNQDIFLHGDADSTLGGYGGWVLVCDGSNWFEAGIW